LENPSRIRGGEYCLTEKKRGRPRKKYQHGLKLPLLIKLHPFMDWLYFEKSFCKFTKKPLNREEKLYWSVHRYWRIDGSTGRAGEEEPATCSQTVRTGEKLTSKISV